jgi:hypothetical protein
MIKKKKLPKIDNNELVIIFWEDTTSCDGWMSPEDKADFLPKNIQTCGWVLGFDEVGIKVTSTYAEDGESNVIIIPIGCVKGILRIIDNKGKVIGKEIKL